MAYQAAIQRSDPTALLFLVDQSRSMEDRMAGSERTKAQFVADVLNRTLTTLIVRCKKSDGVRDYFNVGVLGYGGDSVTNGFHGVLSQTTLQPISVVEANPLRIEERKRKVDDGAGGLVDQLTKFPVWFEPKADGGTPMRAAIMAAAEALAGWCDAHPRSYPPTVLHVTDGDSTDGDPEELADTLRQFQTEDGNVLLLNLHVSSQAGQPVQFPASENALADQYAKLLFRMSSQLPEHLVRVAQEKGIAASFESRGFMFNAEAEQIVNFFDIGTRASQLR
ncbi:VWA domain-containing protein [Burkholderia pseudomallei]|uniref:VWA domain-containing protein n=1 Tax=Burkholderia pseudomallei TaxID=28450 RepID=UPI001A96D49D|nr:VWA domain-containing protein [Burkholderia pseudomallei]QSY06560.1 VWA domain-containing protein [Burkholderia pseudomallei]QSY14343.1 VWA domain-containing protein [Burkholderia pseudomallei]QTB63937.1 VWA domain-containing protein [Burkholderia pseudomallei]